VNRPWGRILSGGVICPHDRNPAAVGVYRPRPSLRGLRHPLVGQTPHSPQGRELPQSWASARLGGSAKWFGFGANVGQATHR